LTLAIVNKTGPVELGAWGIKSGMTPTLNVNLLGESSNVLMDP
jgi:hypothetical protein